MTRPLPPEVASRVKPMPSSFAPAFTDHGHYLQWSSTLDVADHGPVEVELGFHHRRAIRIDGPDHLRASAWQATELARLGRLDLLSHARKDRHKARRKG